MLFTAVWEREGKMAGTPKEEIKRIADQFAFTGELVSCGPCGSGHINETYMLRYRIGEMGSIKVILQKINREIFQKPEELMENIAGVTGHLKKKVLQKGGDPEREVLNLIPTKDGKAFLTDENGECWRAYMIWRKNRRIFMKVQLHLENSRKCWQITRQRLCMKR